MRTHIVPSVSLVVILSAFAWGLAANRHEPAGLGAWARVKHAPVQVHRGDDGRVKLGSRNELFTQNWSGYAVAHFETGRTYTSAQGTWTVPSVRYADGGPDIAAEYASSWVGIGGFCTNANCTQGDNSLIQLGTEQDASSTGTTQYYAWFEMLPRYAVQIPMAIHAGDQITASVTCVAACSKNRQTWTLAMTNATTGQHWSQTVQYASSRLSAEWIEEAPSSSAGVLPLANFATASFDESTVDGTSPSLASSEIIVMQDPYGQTSNPSVPDSDVDGFGACWGAGSLAPCGNAVVDAQ